ncbi:hypothetical protein A6A04_12200 [Paramagnetospirillum marisnigri]|uniref:Methyltransferase domain-containing protein n=1 Tax=Paramagnetospirillum marisnigri TaxID=1285242 RepID=A0A178MYL9_9PROT|nr:class I SAM-dependent methyltransferase [Paramagnetospirillum marisnigri]OAN54679.1 hypothetical protein A6A04_12200 [Paramagnetospirillum marisnigri]
MRKKGGQVQGAVKAQYERFPYPPPVESLSDDFLSGRVGTDGCPSRDFHMYWPNQTMRGDLDILVAGCGSRQAVETACNLPAARITAIDLSQSSIDHSRKLAARHGIENIHFQQMSLLDVAELGRDFDLIICSGVLHHLPVPEAGLAALRGVLRRDGSMALMLYGRYGRDSVYLFQDIFRRMGFSPDTVTDDDLAGMVDLVRNAPAGHPHRLRQGLFSNFRPEEVVDLYLHPQDRPYTVPDILDLLDSTGMRLQRWVRQSAYWPRCSGLAERALSERISRLDERQQWAIAELYAADINRHFFLACRDDRLEDTYRMDFSGGDFISYVPELRWCLSQDARMDGQPGREIGVDFAHVKASRLALDVTQAAVVSLVDGRRSVGDIIAALAPAGEEALALSYLREFFHELWLFDFVLFQTPMRSSA